MGFMKKNLNFLRILSSDMSKSGSRLLHDEAIGVDVSTPQLTTKASSSGTANNHFQFFFYGRHHDVLVENFK